MREAARELDAEYLPPVRAGDVYRIALKRPRVIGIIDGYFQSVPPALRDFWDDPYFRGAITGLGFVNIYIALLEAGRLIRRSTPRQR